MLGKKGEAVIAVIITIIIVWIIAAVFYGGYRNGCRSDSECGNNAYCGADKSCHNLQVIEKTIIEKDYSGPALIIAAALVIAAIILKWDSIKGKLREGHKVEVKPYYKENAEE